MPATQLEKNTWLQSLWLEYDPFEYLDAGRDPHISDYLIGHRDFERLREKRPALLFAPAGGGKTAFRVRLAADCRAEVGGRRIFPLLFLFPDPETLESPPNESRYFQELTRSSARELLLYLAHHAYVFSSLDSALQQDLKGFLQANLNLDYYLNQIEDADSLDPLIEAFDPTARNLPIPPLPETLRAFCQTMRQVSPSPRETAEPQEEFRRLQKLLRRLDLEAVFVLVDGADAYDAEPEKILQWLEPLLNRTTDWADQGIFVKYFLPEELEPLILRNRKPLTNSCLIVKIEWQRADLVRVLRERLYVASGNLFDSFRAIGTPDLPPRTEEKLAEAVKPVLPREALYLAGQIWVEHIKRVGPSGRISQSDLEGAIKRYQEERER